MRKRAVGLVMLSVLLGVSEVAGQTRFTWPADTTVNWSHYTTVEECEAALQRSQRDVERLDYRNGVWQDTMPDYESFIAPGNRKSADEMRRTPGPTITRVTQSCMARFANVDSVPIDRYLLYTQLYLAADWTTKLKPLLARLVKADPTQFHTALGAVLDSVGQTPTARYKLFEELALEFIPQVASSVERAVLYGRLIRTADTVAAIRAAKRMEQFIADSLKAADRVKLQQNLDRIGVRGQAGTNDLDNWMRGVFASIRWHEDAELDSLRKSTEAYLNLGFSQRYPVKKRTPEGKDTTIMASFWNMGNAVGQPAAPIQAEAWAGRSDSTPLPIKGHVSLIVYLSPGWCTTPSGSERTWTCPVQMAALRRLSMRFPKLDIIIVARADGVYRWLTTTPAREAELVRQLLAANDVKATVAMTSREFYRRAQPDGRRVDRSTVDPNWRDYRDKIRERMIANGVEPDQISIVDEPYGDTGALGLLVDENNIIVLWANSVSSDLFIGRYVDALFKRK